MVAVLCVSGVIIAVLTILLLEVTVRVGMDRSDLVAIDILLGKGVGIGTVYQDRVWAGSPLTSFSVIDFRFVCLLLLLVDDQASIIR